MASQRKSRGSFPLFWSVTIVAYVLAGLQQAHSQASAQFGAFASPVFFNEFQPAGTTVAIIDVATYGVPAAGGMFSIPVDGDARYFRISTVATDTGASGNLTSAVVFDGKNPPQEQFTFTVTFTAVDGVTTASATVYVQLQYVNQPPHFANRTYDVWLPDDTPSGLTFFTLTADDSNPIVFQYVPDENGMFTLQYLDDSGVVTYSIDGGFGSNLFTVDPQTGQLSLAPQVDLQKVTTANEFNLTVRATDGVGLTDVAFVYVHVTAVNAHAPVITSPLNVALSLPEDTPVGYTVLSEINATDEDAGSNGHVRYLISAGNVAGTFSIDTSTGRLVVSAPLSWIAAPNYDLVIVAQDGGTPPLSDSTMVVVHVLRVYNYPPVFSQASYVATVQENLRIGIEVVQVVAFEPIVEDFVNYSIVSGSNGAFAIDQLSGLIQTNATLIRKLTPSYNMTVMAVDNYANQSLRMSAFATVYVEVNSSNDYPPLWALPAYKMDTFAAPIRTDIGIMTATSDNKGTASVITYSFSSRDPTRPWAFRIYPATGLVRTNESVRIDIQEYYYYTVRAEVSTSLFLLYTDVPLTIQVHTLDLFPPMFSVHSVNITLIQNVTVGKVVLNQTAVDWDTGLNGMVWYRILTPFDPSAGSFDVNATSGQVYVNTSLNYGLKRQIFFVLQAYDGGYPVPLTDTINVTVFVLHMPLIVLPDGYEIVIPEGEPANFSVITLRNYTFDPDEGSGGIFNYLAIEAYNNSPAPSFKIDNQSGQITTLRSFSYSAQPIIDVTILMQDFSTPPLQRYQNITIFIILPPQFMDNASVSVYEYLPNAVVLNEYRATNLGLGVGSEIITYSIIDGDPLGEFKIDPSSSGINVTRALNRTRQGSYTLKILAVDHGTPPLSGTGHVFVTVLEYNKHAPVFTQNSYNPHFFENATTGSVIFRLNATDQDTGVNAQFHYFMSNTSNTTRFTVRNTTGEIVTNGTFHREALSVFTIVVIAVDSGLVPGPLTGTATVQIFLDDVNDYPPVFNASLYNSSTVEHALMGTPVLFVYATDRDPTRPNNVIRYTLADNMDNLFAINPVSGEVYVNDTIDWTDGPVIEITVIATDLGTPPMSDTCTVFVMVTNVNYYAPVYEVLTLSILENQPAGTEVGCVLAMDADNPGNNSKVYYSLLHDPTGWAFMMNASGCVIANMTFDREDIPQYNVTVLAADYGSPPKSTTGILTVIVLDVNDNSPIFESPLYTATLSEIIPIGTSILRVRAPDMDVGTNALVSYSIVENTTAVFFSVNISSGILYASHSYLYELQQFYQFHILAQDSGVPPLNATALVQIFLTDYNVHPPAFGQSSYSAQVRENLAPGHVILRVNSTDADSGTNAVTSYSLAPTPGSEYFSIDSESGVLYTTTFIDREKTPAINLTVVANNTMSDHPLSSTAPVFLQITDLNDNNPSFPLTVNVTVSESVLAGSVISTLVATDGDAGSNGTVLYFIYNGNDNGTFVLDPNSGNLSISHQLNFQTKPLYMFSVMVHDLGTPNLYNYTNILVTVIDTNDNAPAFTSDVYVVTVASNLVSGQVVAYISAFDIDQNTSLRYSLSGGSSLFKLASNTSGIVVFAGSGVLSSAQNVTIQVSDSVYIASTQLQIQPYKNTILTLKMSNFNTSVTQSAQTGSTIYNLASIIQTGSGITYSIESGNARGTFNLSSSTLALAGNLSYKNQSLYELTIGARDGTGNKVYALLHIQVNDTNKYPPLFLLNTTFIAIPETASINMPLFSFVTTDLDGSAVNRYAACSFQPQTSSVLAFAPLSCQLQLSTTSGLDYLKGPRTYNLTVNASNTVRPALSSTSQLSIIVLNGNKISPQLNSLSEEQHYVYENSTVGTVIATANATDPDIGSSGDITYGMFGAQHHYLDFTIDTYTGVIWQSNTLSYKRQSSYTLTVVAGDGGNPGRTDTTTVSIQIVELNDKTPAWQQLNYTAAILEDVTVNTQVITVSATDGNYVDTSDPLPHRRIWYGYVSYSISAGDPLGQFAIDIDTGIVTVVARLDREQISAYNLTLTATDGGGLYNNTYLYIQVLDVNDNSPLFSSSAYNATMPENAPVGTFMIQLAAADKDIGTNAIFTFAIIGGNTYNSFRINATTGNVYTNAPLNRENTSVYYLMVIATDGGWPQLSSSVNLSVRILDINDNAPSFAQKWYNGSVFENRTIGFIIMQLVATDPDYGENGTVTYSIVTQNSSVLLLPFSINISTGILAVNAHLSYKVAPNYTFTVLAQDSGNAPIRLWSVVNVTINILALNQYPPLFLNASYIGYIFQSAGPSTSILTVSAFDNDAGVNAQILFSLDFRGSVQASTNFAIDPVTGRVGTSNTTTLRNVTTLVYSVAVVATDMGVPPLSSSANLTIVVINAPQFNQSIYSGQIYENQPRNTFTTTVTATSRNEVGYSVSTLITSQGDCRALCSNATFCSSSQFALLPLGLPLPFTANFSTNVIVSTTSFDRENISEYVVTVKAYDIAANGSLYSTSCLRVSILDVNDNRPIFSKQMYWANISENACNGTPVTTVMATDADSGTNAVFHYSIISGGGNFTINSTSGLILTIRSGFVYERQNVYSITVLAKDDGTPSLNSTATVTIALWDENNYPPVFSQAKYSSSILEDLPAGSTVLTVSATDTDSGLNSLVTFSINSSTPAGDFVINSTTGIITTLKPLDRESIPFYNLSLVAMDHGMPPLYVATSVTITVLDVNDNPPLFVGTPYVVNITENALPSIPILNMSATDADTGTNALVFFSLVGVIPRSNAFQVNLMTGALSLTTPLDAEVCVLYTVIVNPSNGPAQPYQATLVNISVNVLDVNDNVPYFYSSSYAVNVSEHATVGSQVAELVAKDNDATLANSIVSYLIIGGFNMSLFSINSTTGIVYLHLPLNKQDAYYRLIVQAQDNGSPPLRSNATLFITVLHINDYPPFFLQTPYTFQIFENEPAHTLIGKIQAYDIDFQEVASYALSNSGSDFTFFSINSSTGQLYSAQSFDSEIKSVYHIVAFAIDNGTAPRTSQVNITIIILNVYDYPPAFLQDMYNALWLENTPLGTVLLTINAKHQDMGNDSRIEYLLVSGKDSLHFAFNHSDSGNISLAKGLDREQQDLFRFMAIARDTGYPYLNTTTNITILVLDVNDNAPVQNAPSYNTTLLESTPIGTIIMAVSATDNDIGVNALMSFSLSNSYNNLFVIGNVSSVPGSASCTLWLNGTLDYEIVEGYSFFIVAKDAGLPSLSFSSQVNISVNDLNDNDFPPIFSASIYNVTVPENTLLQSSIFRLVATDADRGNMGVVRYSIISGNSGDTFSIDAATGWITSTNFFNRAITSSYTLAFLAYDLGTPSFSAHATLQVTVRDVNNNPPTFSSRVYTIVIPEDTAIGQIITMVLANDRDIGSNANITYAIIAGNTTMFRVGPLSGAVTVAAKLEYKTAKSYDLSIMAQDAGIPPLYDITNIRIVITQVDQYPPAFPQSLYNLTINVNTPLGAPLAYFVATNADAYSSTPITYSLIQSNSNVTKFAINPNTGALSVIISNFATGQINIIIQAEGATKFYPTNATLLVNVVSNAQVLITFIPTSVSVYENASLQSIIAQMNLPGPATISSTSRLPFSIQSNGTLSLTAPLDVKTTPAYCFNVKATVDASTTFYSIVTVRVLGVIKQAPQFESNSYRALLSEIAPVNSTVIYVSAFDRNIVQNNLQIQLSMTAGNGFGTFSLDQISGQLLLISMLDYETVSEYNLVITATVSSLSSTVNVTILITAANLHSPKFDTSLYSTDILTNTALGTSIITVHATDIDSGTNSEIHYYITQASIPSSFFMNSTTGTIYSAAVLSPAVYSFTVLAADRGIPALTDRSSVYITVHPVNLYAPVFDSPSGYSLTVPEIQAVGSSLAHITARDVDGDAISYSILGGDTSHFVISPNVGLITLSSSLMYLVQSFYTLTIQAVDTGYPPKSTSVAVNVTLIRVITTPPQFNQSAYSAVAPEDTPVGSVLLRVYATSFQEVAILYSISQNVLSPSTNQPLFGINETTGDIFVSSALDYEALRSAELVVTAVGLVYPNPLSASIHVTVAITDVNDVPPVFTRAVYQATAVRLLPVGQLVLTLAAVFDPNFPLTYSIINNGGGGNLLRIDPISAAITTARQVAENDTANFTIIVGVTNGKYFANATVTVQLVNSGGFCEGLGYCTNIVPITCNILQLLVAPYLLCAPYCNTPGYFLSPMKTVCIYQYCQDPTLFPCNVTNTCNASYAPCGGKCLPGFGLCPSPTNQCFTANLIQPCDGVGQTCLVGQTLVQRANGSRYCASAPTNCNQTGYVYCENTTKCASLSDPLVCAFCPGGQTRCNWTASCILSSELCCPPGTYSCALLGKCLVNGSRCAFPNTAPIATSTLLYLESVTSLNVSAALTGTGRSIGLLLGNGSLAVDSNKDEVGVAITDGWPIASDLGEWQYALCSDIASIDPPGGCSNITSPWNRLGSVSESQALVLTNMARLRFVRRDVRLEGAVWLRVKLWDGNQDGYLSTQNNTVRNSLPFYVSTLPFVHNGAYSNTTTLVAVLVYPIVLLPSFSFSAPLRFSGIAEDTPFIENHGNAISDLVTSVSVLYLPVLPNSTITGWPVNQSYDSQLPMSARSQYLAQLAAVNPIRLHRKAALDSGQLPGVGVSIDPTSTASGHWQVSWNGEEQYYTNLDALLSSSNATTLLLNTTAILRFLPNSASCGNVSILLQPWDGYWNSSSSVTGAQSTGYILIRGSAGDLVYSTNAWQRTTLKVTCVAYSPTILAASMSLDPIPYQINYHYDSIYRILVVGALSSIDFPLLESSLKLSLLSNVQVLRLAAANATHTDILFRVVGTQLNVSTVTSRISAFNYILATQSILIAGVFQDFSYGPGIGCPGTSSSPYYGTVVNRLISNVSSDKNGDFLGMAITSYQAPLGQGAWQYHSFDSYSQDIDPTRFVWFNFPPEVSDTRALLLHGSDRIRFVPRPGYFWSSTNGSTPPSITAKAWDMTLGIPSNELSLLNVNTNPNVDTLQSLTHPIGRFSVSTVTVAAIRYGCDGVPNSGVVHDVCCVCGGNGSQCKGCDSILGSKKMNDSCGVCGGRDISCLGCDFVPFSNTSRSSLICGCVSNGATGVVYGFADCHGDCYGTSITDDCGVCSGSSTGHQYDKDIDCMGTCFGNATVDLCGDCTGPGTPYPLNQNLDCTGVCGGPFRADSCGACQLPDSNGMIIEHRDCTGACFGSAKRDSCGVCYGGSTSVLPNTLLDACGVCRGDNSTCSGCDGVANSGQVVDNCGVCGGNDCDCFKIVSVSPGYSPQNGSTVLTVRGAGFFVNQSSYNRKLPNCNVTRFASVGTTTVTGICRIALPSNLGVFQPIAYLVNQSVLNCVAPALPMFSSNLLNVTLQVSIGGGPLSNPLTIVYYQNVSTLTTSMNPTDVEVGKAATVSIQGQGFVSTSASVCKLTLYSTLSSCSFATPLTTPASYLGSTQMACSLPVSYQPCQIFLVLQLNGQTSGQVSKGFVFTYRSRAPQVSDVNFSDDLSSLVVQFDRSVSLNGTSSISNVFADATYVLLGGLQATYQWIKPYQRGIVISLPVSATVMVNSSIGFRDGTVVSNGTLFPYAITNVLVPVSPYTNAVSPLAVLNGPSSIPVCGQAVFSAVGSLYAGYRPLKYHWDVFAPDILHPGYNSLLAFFNSIPDSSSQISINSSLFQPNVTYTLQLVVTNAIGLSSIPVVKPLVRWSTETLSISFGGPLAREYEVNSPLLIESTIQLMGCTNKPANFTLQWSIYSVTSTRPYTITELSLPGIYKSSSSIFIPAGTLAENGSFVLTLRASTVDSLLSSKLSLNLTTVLTPLKAWILGGSVLTISRNYTLVLDGSTTTFSSLLPIPTYEWSCITVATSGPCFNQSTLPYPSPIVLPHSNTIRMPAGVLVSGSDFNFTMRVSQGTQQSLAMVIVTTLPALRLPRTNIVTQGSTIATVTSKLTLEGLVYSVLKVTDVHWESVPLPGQGYVDLASSTVQSQVYYPSDTATLSNSNPTLNPLQASITTSLISRANFILAPNTLSPGLAYTFALVATNQDGTSYSNITITANSAPHSPTLQVNPSTGVAMSTVFTLFVTDPADNTINIPFMYQFGLVDSSCGITWLTGPQTSGTIAIVLPRGNPLTLQARITDKSGSYVDVNTSCSVSPQPLTGAAFLTSQLSNITMRYSADKDWRAALADTMVLFLEANSTATMLPFSFKSSALGLVSAIMNGPLPQTSADYSVVASLLSLITTVPGQYNLDNAMSIVGQLAGWFGSQAVLSTYNLTPRQPDGLQPSVLLSNTSGALNPNSTSALGMQTAQKILDSMTQIASITSAKPAATLYTNGIQSIGQALCKQIVTGENPVFLSTSISQLFVRKGAPLGAFNVSNLLVDFGSSLAASYNTSACGSPYIACDEACIQGVAYTRDLFANSSAQVLQVSPAAAQMINSSIAGIDTQRIWIYSNIFSVSISIPNQNKYMNVSGLSSPFQVYIPAQMLPSQASVPLCFYRSLVNASSAPNDMSFLWTLDSTVPPRNTTIGGKQYFVCSFTHLTEFVIGSLPPPVIATPLPAIITTTSVNIMSSSSMVVSKTRKVSMFNPTTPPRTTIVTAQADVVTPAVGSVIPIIVIIAAVVGVVVTLYIFWRKKHNASIKIMPVKTLKTESEPIKKPSTPLLTPEQSKVPMEVIKLTESGERVKVGKLNVLPSIRLRELRQQIVEDLEAFKGKPFYLMTKQLCDIEPAAEQQMFVSLVFGTKFIFVREVSDSDEYARQFCICGKAAQFLCTGCISQGYCSEECQGIHWESQHQRECNVLSEKRRRNEILHQHRQVSIAGLASAATTPGVTSSTTDWKSFLKASRPTSQVAIKISPEKPDASSVEKSVSWDINSQAAISPSSQHKSTSEVTKSPDAPLMPTSPQGTATQETALLQRTTHEPEPQVPTAHGTDLQQRTLPETALPQHDVTLPAVILDEPRPSVLSPLPQWQTNLGPMEATNRLPQVRPLGLGISKQFVSPLARPPSLRAPLPKPPFMSSATTPGIRPPFLTQTPVPRPVLISPVSTTAGIATSPYLSPNASSVSPNLPVQPNLSLFPLPHLQSPPRVQPQSLFDTNHGLSPTLNQPLSPLPQVFPVSKIPPQQAMFQLAKPQQQKHSSVFSTESRLIVQSVVPDDLAMSMSLNASMFKKVRDEPVLESDEDEDATSEEGDESSEANLKESEDSSDSSDDAEEEEDAGVPAVAPPPLQPKTKSSLTGDKSVN